MIKALCHILFLSFFLPFYEEKELILFSGMLSPPVAAFPELQPLLALWILPFTIPFLVRTSSQVVIALILLLLSFLKIIFRALIFPDLLVSSSMPLRPLPEAQCWHEKGRLLLRSWFFNHPHLLSGLPPEYS